MFILPTQNVVTKDKLEPEVDVNTADPSTSVTINYLLDPVQ